MMYSRRRVIADLGYKLDVVIKEEDRHSVFLVKEGKKMMLLKVSEKGTHHIRKEVDVNLYIHSASRISAPFSRMREHADFTVAEYQYIHGQAYADDANKEVITVPSDYDIALLAQALEDFDAFQFENVPVQIQNEFEYYPKEYYVARLLELKGQVCKNGVKEKDFDALVSFIRQADVEYAFQHHDFVLWNMIRSEGGEVFLVDPEFSRWGLRWYDAAYFYIQSATYLHAEDVGRRLLRALFPETIPEQIYIPLSYRIIVNLSELDEDAALKKRTFELFDRIQKRRL